jgi:hypothetical protein
MSKVDVERGDLLGEAAEAALPENGVRGISL